MIFGFFLKKNTGSGLVNILPAPALRADKGFFNIFLVNPNALEFLSERFFFFLAYREYSHIIQKYTKVTFKTTESLRHRKKYEIFYFATDFHRLLTTSKKQEVKEFFISNFLFLTYHFFSSQCKSVANSKFCVCLWLSSPVPLWLFIYNSTFLRKNLYLNKIYQNKNKDTNKKSKYGFNL